jgi:predicted transcriptional regulator of viral defense system
MPLTPREQELLGVLPGYSSLEEIEHAAGIGKKYLSELLARLVEKRALVRVRKGVFFKTVAPIKNFEYLYGLALAGGRAFVALASALKLHGLLDEELSEYHFATQNTRKTKEFRGLTFRLIPFGKDYYGTQELNGILVSTKTKTVYDCLCRIGSVGRRKLAVVLKTNPLSEREWKEILLFFQTNRNKSLKQRTGFFLEKERIAPEFFLRKLEVQIGRKNIVKLAPEAARLDKRWMVYYENS